MQSPSRTALQDRMIIAADRGLFADLLPERDWRKEAKQAAWDLYVLEYAHCVDADPGDARARYLATVARIEGHQAGEGGR